MIIGISGLKGSGKDTIADYLFNSYDYTKWSFADPIKEMMLIAFPKLNPKYLYGNSEFRNKEIAPGITIRKALQTLGTDWGRNMMYEDIWVDNLFDEYDSNRNLVISDLRFVNEARAIKKRGGKIWYVTRNDSGDDHISENEMKSVEFQVFVDNYIDNSGSIEQLYSYIDGLIKWE